MSRPLIALACLLLAAVPAAGGERERERPSAARGRMDDSALLQEAKIDLRDALAKAAEKHPGKILGARLAVREDKACYLVQVMAEEATGRILREVVVDAGSGALVGEPRVILALPVKPGPDADGIEEPEPWKASGWGDAAAISWTEEKPTKGKKAILAAPEGDGPAKVTILRSWNLDLSGASSCAVDARAAKGGVFLSVGFRTEDGEYYESRAVRLADGENPGVAFDLEAAAFKTDRSDWKHTQALKGREHVTEVFLVLFGVAKDNGVTLDNLRFVERKEAAPPAPPPPASPAAPPAPKPPEGEVKVEEGK